jgi:hypothetical protein
MIAATASQQPDVLYRSTIAEKSNGFLRHQSYVLDVSAAYRGPTITGCRAWGSGGTNNQPR